MEPLSCLEKSNDNRGGYPQSQLLALLIATQALLPGIRAEGFVESMSLTDFDMHPTEADKLLFVGLHAARFILLQNAISQCKYCF